MLLKDSLHGCDIIHDPSARKLFYLQSFHASGKFLSILKILPVLYQESIFQVDTHKNLNLYIIPTRIFLSF